MLFVGYLILCSSLSSAMQHALTLVFVETKRGADVLEGWLLRSGFSAVAIHGDKVQMVCMFYLPFISSFVIRVPSSLMPYRYRFSFQTFYSFLETRAINSQMSWLITFITFWKRG